MKSIWTCGDLRLYKVLEEKSIMCHSQMTMQDILAYIFFAGNLILSEHSKVLRLEPKIIARLKLKYCDRIKGENILMGNLADILR
jgi:hypothetical protein